ncbi:MAG: Dabb family protein [Bacteroidales bacterium]|nr:Dabb family protein [Bacteroidales bacterium]
MKKQSRFSTNKTLALTIFFMLFSIMAWAGKPKKTEFKVKGIQQVLLIKFKKGTSDSTIQQIAVQAFNLGKKARTLKSVEWGKKTQLSDDTKDYDYCLTFNFSNETNFEIFNQNPIKMEFMGKLYPVSAELLKFTYKVEKDK